RDYDLACVHPFPYRMYLLYRTALATNQKEIARFSKADAEALPRYEKFWEGFGEMLEPTLLAPPVPLADLASFVTTPEAEDFLRRILFMSIADLLDEYFESEEVKASLATSAVAGTMAGPETPGTAFVLGHHTLGDIGGKKGPRAWRRAGMGGVSASMARSARHHRAVIRTGA